jgi:hypothetical protein
MPIKTLKEVRKMANLSQLFHAERKAEEEWSHILSNANISASMQNPEQVSRMAGNWRYFIGEQGLGDKGLSDVTELTNNFKSYLDSRAKKNAPTLNRKDLEIFVADKVWETKLKNDAILSDALKLKAQFWDTDRAFRGRLHEAFTKAGKWHLEQVTHLLSSAGIDLSKVDLKALMDDYAKQQQRFLDDLLKTRQGEAKAVLANEISKAFLPEAK